jgi:hypothetical protein
MRTLFLVAIALAPCSLLADPKEELIKAIVEQCKVQQDEASKLATAGRTGTIVKYTLCQKSTVEIKEECTVVCEIKGAKIGQ